MSVNRGIHSLYSPYILFEVDVGVLDITGLGPQSLAIDEGAIRRIVDNRQSKLAFDAHRIAK